MRESLLRWRDRLIASTRFQHRASRFPLTRPIARKRARELFDIATGFVYSQVLAACVRADLFEFLADGPRSVTEIATAIALPEDATERLLKAAAALRLLQPRRGGYGLGDLGAAVRGNPGVGAMVAHHEHLYRDLTDPLALLRNRADTSLSGYWPYDSEGTDEVKDYSELMSASQSFVAEDILDAYPMDRHRHLWDIAGGLGTFISSALKRWPDLSATVLDLPPVAAMAAGRLSAAGLAHRATALAGDMFKTPLEGVRPDGVTPAAEWNKPDLVSLVRVVHDHDDEPVKQLFRALKSSMPPGARLLLAEPMADTAGAKAMGDAYFGMYLWAMGSGRPRSAPELRDMLEEAGFSNCRELKSHRPLLVRILLADA